MRPFVLALLSLRNVRRYGSHSVAAVLSIAVGFVAIALFEGYLDDMQARQTDGFRRRAMLGDLVVQRAGADSQEARQDPLAHALGVAEQEQLEHVLREAGAQVATVARFLDVSGMVRSGSVQTIFVGAGYDVAAGETLRGPWAWNVVAGEPLGPAQPDGAVLGRSLAAALDCEADAVHTALDGDGIPLPVRSPLHCARDRLLLTTTTARGQLNVGDVKVRGLLSVMLKESDEVLLMLPLEAAQRLLDTKVVSSYRIALAPAVDPSAFAAALSARAQQAGLALEIVPWRRHPSAALLVDGLATLSVYRWFIALVVVTVAGMSVAITMTKSVSERTREIGTLRSLGFRQRQIVRLFAWESVWIAALAVLVGAVLSLALTLVLNRAGIAYDAGVLAEKILLRIAFDPAVYARATLFLIAVALASSLRAARRGARLTIAAALGDSGA